MSDVSPFSPHYGSGQILTASTTSAAASINSNDKVVRIVNSDATNIVYFKIGKGTITATAADPAVLPMSEIRVRKGEEEDKIAYLSAAGTAVIQIITGNGGI